MRTAMVDLGWLYTIVEASATFVAIVGAFFTTKILSIASEKRTLSNRVELLREEIEQRNKVVDRYQEEEINPIRFKWAEEEVEPFLESVKYDVDPHSPPSLEELIKLFEEEKNATANFFERELLKRKYEDFLHRVQEVEKEREEERKRREEEERRRLEELKKSPLFGLSHIFDALSTRWARTHALMTMPELELPDVATIRWETEQLDKAMEKQEEELRQIEILEIRKKEYEEQLKSISFPRYIRFGFLSLVYFAVVGVAIPLAYSLWLEYLKSYLSEFHIFIFFLSGLIVTFLYLDLEIQELMKTPKEIKKEEKRGAS